MAAAGEPFLRDRAGAGRLPTPFDNDRRCGMSQLDLVDNDVPQTHENAASSAYVPALQVTAGQPEPIAANGGRSYMAFDRNDDAGTGDRKSTRLNSSH